MDPDSGNSAGVDLLATEIVDLLRQNSAILVLAESCTSGLIAATLGRVPGVSQVLAGSAVVYQVETKAIWLKINRGLLEKPGPVSAEVAAAMAAGVLNQSPHATLALSVTGHLGPDAAAGLDGVAFTAIASRNSEPKWRRLSLLPASETEHAKPVMAENMAGNTAGDIAGNVVSPGRTMPTASVRVQRQQDAVLQCLSYLQEWLQSYSGGSGSSG